MMLEATEDFLGLLRREMNVYTFKKNPIVSIGTKIEKNSLVNGVVGIEANFN